MSTLFEIYLLTNYCFLCTFLIARLVSKLLLTSYCFKTLLYCKFTHHDFYRGVYNGFDHQERNFVFAKMDFQVIKLKFYACSMKQAF